MQETFPGMPLPEQRPPAAEAPTTEREVAEQLPILLEGLLQGSVNTTVEGTVVSVSSGGVRSSFEVDLESLSATLIEDPVDVFAVDEDSAQWDDHNTRPIHSAETIAAQQQTAIEEALRSIAEPELIEED
jgi:hypothetical protein